MLGWQPSIALRKAVAKACAWIHEQMAAEAGDGVSVVAAPEPASPPAIQTILGIRFSSGARRKRSTISRVLEVMWWCRPRRVWSS